MPYIGLDMRLIGTLFLLVFLSFATPAASSQITCPDWVGKWVTGTLHRLPTSRDYIFHRDARLQLRALSPVFLGRLIRLVHQDIQDEVITPQHVARGNFFLAWLESTHSLHGDRYYVVLDLEPTPLFRRTHVTHRRYRLYDISYEGSPQEMISFIGDGMFSENFSFRLADGTLLVKEGSGPIQAQPISLFRRVFRGVIGTGLKKPPLPFTLMNRDELLLRTVMYQEDRAHRYYRIDREPISEDLMWGGHEFGLSPTLEPLIQEWRKTDFQIATADRWRVAKDSRPLGIYKVDGQKIGIILDSTFNTSGPFERLGLLISDGPVIALEGACTQILSTSTVIIMPGAKIAGMVIGRKVFLPQGDTELLRNIQLSPVSEVEMYDPKRIDMHAELPID